MAQSIKTIESDGLRMHVFVSAPVIFQVTSVVVEGESEVALIDAQFSADNAQRVVDLIKKTGKPLKTIFVSYSDPDFYFGLDLISRAFPEARILSTPQTRWIINATKDDKMAVWAPQLGANAPARIVVPESLYADHFMLDGHRIEVRQARGDEQHAFLWIPSARTILGGVYVLDWQHVWVADSPTPADRTRWIAGLDSMAALKPAHVIPAHFDPPQGSDPIAFTRRYLTDFEDALAGSKTSDGVIARMKSLYPTLSGLPSLEMSARVLKGETAWQVVDAFPAICRKAEVNFGGEYLFELDFRNEHTMTFRGLVERAGGRPITDTVEYTAVQVAPEVYMVYWTEHDNTHVVHVEDFGRGVAYTNISAPDGSFANLRGTLRLLP